MILSLLIKTKIIIIKYKEIIQIRILYLSVGIKFIWGWLISSNTHTDPHIFLWIPWAFNDLPRVWCRIQVIWQKGEKLIKNRWHPCDLSTKICSSSIKLEIQIVRREEKKNTFKYNPIPFHQLFFSSFMKNERLSIINSHLSIHIFKVSDQ